MRSATGSAPLAVSVENRLLLAAAAPTGADTGVAPGPERPSERGREPVLDWDLLTRLAVWHRMAPLVDRHVRRHHMSPPTAVSAALRRHRTDTAGHNLVLLAEVGRLVAALDGEGIDTVVLKGAALLRHVYSDLSLRPMVDIDLLVPSGQIARAEEAILDLGYRCEREAGAETHRQIREAKYAYPLLVSSDYMTRVDLHRHLVADAPRFDLAGFRSRAGPRSGDPAGPRFPDDEDLLLHLGMHFFKDRTRTSTTAIGQLADLAWLVEEVDIDWDSVVQRALLYGIGTRIFLSLAAARDLLGAALPVRPMADLQPDDWEPRLSERFLRRRVLSTQPWPGHGYFNPLHPGLRRRLVPRREDLGAGAAAARQDPYWRSYLRRLKKALSYLEPARRVEDLRLDRWMRDLGDSGAGRRRPPTLHT